MHEVLTPQYSVYIINDANSQSDTDKQVVYLKRETNSKNSLKLDNRKIKTYRNERLCIRNQCKFHFTKIKNTFIFKTNKMIFAGN